MHYAYQARRLRAMVRNEDTDVEPWFVYVESDMFGRDFACRFRTRTSADKVAAAINKAYEREGRLLVYGEGEAA